MEDPRIHLMKLSEPHFGNVMVGTKTLEARMNDDKRKRMSVGDKIIFTNDAGNYTITRTIVNKKVFYEGFVEAVCTITAEGDLQKLIPGAEKEQDALDVYFAIPGYAEASEVVVFYFV